jgi:hypothetical protein
MEEAATPLPSEETTPPVTNIYFGAIRIARVVTRFTTPDFSYLSGEAAFTHNVSACRRIDVQTIMSEACCSVNSNSLRLRIEKFSSFSLTHNLFAIPGFVSRNGAVGVAPEIQPARGTTCAEHGCPLWPLVQLLYRLLLPTHDFPCGSPCNRCCRLSW